MQIHLCIIINNFRMPVRYSAQLYVHLATRKLIPLQFFEQLGHTFITAPISGFHVSSYPLWKLGYFLDENWLEEDILNTLAEMLYFQTAAVDTGPIPRFVYLPTSFFNDASFLFQQSPQIYSPELLHTQKSSTHLISAVERQSRQIAMRM